MNVRRQVVSLARTTVIRQAWGRAQPVSIHGWIYSVEDGLLHDLDCSINSLGRLDEIMQAG